MFFKRRYSFKQNMLLLVNKDALLYFCGGLPKETSWQVSLNLTQLFQRRCFVSNGWRTDWLAYAWTDDRQRPIRIPHFEYRAQVSLKQVIAYVTININTEAITLTSSANWAGDMGIRLAIIHIAAYFPLINRKSLKKHLEF